MINTTKNLLRTTKACCLHYAQSAA